MADFLQGLFGGAKSSVSSAAPAADTDFADYATAASPSPASHAAPSAADSSPIAASPTGLAARPYTKWYRVWERTQVSDFYQEMFILPVVLIFVVIHVWGTKTNKRKARSWITAHAPVLQQEFASVGYGGGKTPITADDFLKERKADEYTTYATGRQNIAFVDLKLTLLKRYNPLMLLGETVLSFFFDSLPAPEERMEATAYSFDARETSLVTPRTLGDTKVPNSGYEGFVWAIVHKDMMKRLRNDRYDLSLTTTKDHPKLPDWATVMTENAEITETLLTPELIKAVAQAGEVLDGLIISDQPIDQPKRLDDTVPKKRVSLALRLPSGSSPSAYESTVPLFQCFIRLTDQLVKDARWRPEVMRRIKQTREEEIRKIRKVDEDEKAEQFKTAGDKRKKEEREAKLKGMNAEQQRKFLDKEREKDARKAQKKRTMRG
ncbi:DUF1682-domain-containing protein [Rhizodiscina lignyota]|uniref:DUF1682-domain-containing protein n=1 Tax=Rhizodiscina lignyota TaxID=1504668 RepID=A0A9P4MDW1_9PEZI|nr:DUF1682-domain-containing protein [Rhizodiscina lignyota]